MNGLKEKRIALGMTQAELARKADTTQSVISILETSNLFPGEELRRRINNALGAEEENNGGKRMTQTERVLDYMEKHGSISQQEAIRDFSCYRLSAKIFELRREGHNILTDRVPFRNEFGSGHYAVYRLAD